MVGPIRSLLTRRLGALGLSILLGPAAAAPAFAQPAGEGPITVTADHVAYNTQTGDVTADGHVKATRGDTTITSDHLTGNPNTGQVRAAGHVTLIQPGRTATGETLTYNYRTRVGEMSPVVVKYLPWTATARSFTTTAGQSVAYNAATTPCDPAHPAFLVRARKVVVVPGDYLTAYGATLYVYGVPVFYVPAYTASLKKGRAARSGPVVGYDNFDGLWVEYAQFAKIGDWDNQARVRYGTRSGWSGEDLISRRFGDHVISGHLGRLVSFDQSGNQFNLDQYSLDVTYDTRRIGALPLVYSFEAHAGSYHESQTGVGSSRAEGLLTLTTDTFPLTPSLTVAAAGYYRYDAYGTGQVRNILAASTAMTQILSRTSSATLSYNLAQVSGSTPFSFDSIGADSAASLSYSYYPGGLFQSGTISGTYDFLSRQTTSSLNVAFTITPRLQFSTGVTYNLTTQQLTEIDYAVASTCDCVALGVLYRTFPTSPSSNQWFVTIGVNTLPGVATALKFGAP